jgi:hypothetical protein
MRTKSCIFQTNYYINNYLCTNPVPQALVKKPWQGRAAGPQGRGGSGSEGGAGGGAGVARVARGTGGAGSAGGMGMAEETKVHRSEEGRRRCKRRQRWRWRQ